MYVCMYVVYAFINRSTDRRKIFRIEASYYGEGFYV